jgi:hypothetical protein
MVLLDLMNGSNGFIDIKVGILSIMTSTLTIICGTQHVGIAGAVGNGLGLRAAWNNKTQYLFKSFFKSSGQREALVLWL